MIAYQYDHYAKDFIEVGFAENVEQFLELAYPIYGFLASDMEPGWPEKVNEYGKLYIYLWTNKGVPMTTYNYDKDTLLNEIKMLS